MPRLSSFGKSWNTSGWERTLGRVVRGVEPSSEVGDRRLAFWETYLEQSPTAAELGIKPSRQPSQWVPISGLNGEAFLSLWIGAGDCGAFMRGPRGSQADEIIAQLRPYAARLEKELGASFDGNAGQFLWKRAGMGSEDEAKWPAIIQWMEETRTAYQSAVDDIVRGHEAGL